MTPRTMTRNGHACTVLALVALAGGSVGVALGQTGRQQAGDPGSGAPQPGRPYPGEAMQEPAVPDPSMQDPMMDDPYATAPPRLQRDYMRPDPNLPWGYRRSRPPIFEPRSYYDYGQFGRRSAFDRPPLHTYDYGYSNYYEYYPPRDGYYDPYQAMVAEAYRQGVDDGRHFEQFERAALMGITSYLDAMDFGLAAFADGRYTEAADGFLLAARLNQGDPASRIHAAQALFAQGLDAEAVAILRRAIELEPRIIHLPLDLRSDYGTPADFELHVAALTERAADPDDFDAAVLLGYVRLFSGRGSAAMEPLARAASLRPDDLLVQRLMMRAQLRSPRNGR